MTHTSGMRTTCKPKARTRKHRKRRKVRWKCGFENSAGKGTICNMVQSHEDTFDWKLRKGATPSRSTGPYSAYRSKYYIYIETSHRKYGDRAM